MNMGDGRQSGRIPAGGDGHDPADRRQCTGDANTTGEHPDAAKSRPIEARRWLTSCLGLGFGPIAPGTWGSLPPVVVYGVMAGCGIGCGVDGGVRSVAVTVVMAVLAVVGAAICVAWAPAAIRACGKSDPSEVVADEFAGQSVALLAAPVPADPWHVLIVAAVAFLAFRLFDIVKPWPCRRLERFPAGWGILLDDLAAGVYALIVVQILGRAVLSGTGT